MATSLLLVGQLVRLAPWVNSRMPNTQHALNVGSENTHLPWDLQYVRSVQPVLLKASLVRARALNVLLGHSLRLPVPLPVRDVWQERLVTLAPNLARAALMAISLRLPVNPVPHVLLAKLLTQIILNVIIVPLVGIRIY